MECLDVKCICLKGWGNPERPSCTNGCITSLQLHHKPPHNQIVRVLVFIYPLIQDDTNKTGFANIHLLGITVNVIAPKGPC